MNAKTLMVSSLVLLLLVSSCQLLEDLEAPMVPNEVEGANQSPSFICATATYMESMPRFPGGSMALLKYIINNVQIPAVPLEEIEGRMLVIQFVVECDGKVSSSKVIRSIHPEIDAAYLQVFEKMPPWEPGQQQGILMRTQMNFPIRMHLE